jgi:hypothetical protein
MKKLIVSILSFAIFLNSTLSASNLFVIDKRTYNTNSGEEKFPFGLFVGIEFKGEIFYKPVAPDGTVANLDSLLEPITAIYIYETHPSYRMFGKLPLKPQQPGVLIGGAVLEIEGNLNTGNLKFVYYHKNKPLEKRELKSDVIKIWQETTPAK